MKLRYCSRYTNNKKNVSKLRDITKKTLLYKTSKHIIKRHKKAYKNDNSEKKPSREIVFGNESDEFTRPLK